MPFPCIIIGHRQGGRILTNGGLDFGRCRRCGSDLIRRQGGAWKEPAGYRIVWPAERPRPVQKAVAAIALPDRSAPVASEESPRAQMAEPEQAPSRPVDSAPLQASTSEPQPDGPTSASPPSPEPQPSVPDTSAPSPAEEDFMADDDDDFFEWDPPQPEAQDSQPATSAKTGAVGRKRGN